jgi:hypothetical protein
MDPTVTEALEDYFNCQHSYTSATLRKEVERRLFNVLTPVTVNTLYRIRTTVGEREYSPLEIATLTENMLLSKHLLKDLDADLFFSIHQMKNLLTTYTMITSRQLLWADHIHPVRHDEIVDILATGIARVKDMTGLSTHFDHAICQSGITGAERMELLQKLRPAIRKDMRELAWSRRRHLIALYAEESI